MFASDAFVHDSFRFTQRPFFYFFIIYPKPLVHRQYAIYYRATCCTRLDLRTAELASSLHLRQLPNHHIYQSSNYEQTAIRTFTHIASLLSHSLTKARLKRLFKRPRHRPPPNLLRPIPQHLPLRPSTRRALHPRPQTTTQRVHPTPSPRPPRPRQRRQTTPSRSSQRPHQRSLQNATRPTASCAVLARAAGH